jgi:hypothetical protein
MKVNKSINEIENANLVANVQALAPAVAETALQNSEQTPVATAGCQQRACSAVDITISVNDIDMVAKENTESCDNMLATGQFFVETGDNIIPLESLEEGSPIRWTKERVGVPILPNWNDGSCETSVASATFQGCNNSILVRGILRAEGRFEGNNDKVDSLLSDVGDFIGAHEGDGLEKEVEQNVQALAPLVAGNMERGSDSESKNDTDGTPLPAVASSVLVLSRVFGKLSNDIEQFDKSLNDPSARILKF